MLKGIPALLSPELLMVLMEMGQGDEIVLCDGNFPAETWSRTVVRQDGGGISPLLDAVLKVFPLDATLERPVALMQPEQGGAQPEIWKTYAASLNRHAPQAKTEMVERFVFWERARRAYAVVATSETAPGASIILRKGIVLPDELG